MLYVFSYLGRHDLMLSFIFVYSTECTSKGDIAFILDSSGSLGRGGFYKVLNFTSTTVGDLDIDTGNFKVSVITFSDNARLEFGLNR